MTQASKSEAENERALADCVGALQFILAFYEPGQRHLDTEAWKVACAEGVAAYKRGATALGWTQRAMRAEDGQVFHDAKAHLPSLAAREQEKDV